MKKLKITFEENNKPKIKYKNYPRIDVNKMYSNSEDTIEQMQVEHIKKIKKESSITLSIAYGHCFCFTYLRLCYFIFVLELSCCRKIHK